MVIPVVAVDPSAKPRTLVSLRALIAKHACIRMGFSNSDRALPVFGPHVGKVDLGPVESKHLCVRKHSELAS